MRLYAESSAVLAWMLAEEEGERARACLESARQVVASELTVLECDRALIRSQAVGRLMEDDLSSLQLALRVAASEWTLLRLAPAVVERARSPFPLEPVRTLDALHVASALIFRAAIPDLAVLSLDTRVRTVSSALGFVLKPD